VIVFLFILYVAIGIAGLKYIPFFKNCTLSFRLLTFIFLMKVGTGVLYGNIHQRYYKGGDTYLYVEKGAFIKSYIHKDVGLFFRLCLGPNHVKPSSELQPHASATGLWTDTSAYTLARLNALIAFLGKGNYNLHIIFWQLFSLIGLVALYKSFTYFYTNEKFKFVGAVFFVPSIIFWHSGIHKEALSIAAIGLTTWSVIQLAARKKAVFLYLFTAFFLGILGLVRIYTLAILLPAAILLYYNIRHPGKILIQYAFVYLAILACGFFVGIMKPEYHFLHHFIKTQQYFEYHSFGNSDIELIALEPNIISLLSNIPKALFRSLLRPSLFDVNPQNVSMRLPAAVETLCICLLLLAAFFGKKMRWFSQQPLLVFCVAISLLYLCLIGLLVPNLGTLFRYKSVVLPLLLPVLLLLANFGKRKE